MAKLNYSNFESLKEIIDEIKIDYEKNNIEKLEKFGIIWKEVVGNKTLQLSKVFGISADNILTIICADSHVANELYFEKNKLLKSIREKAQKNGIEIKDIIFNYKKWKEFNEN